jgi:hypothetical protein
MLHILANGKGSGEKIVEEKHGNGLSDLRRKQLLAARELWKRCKDDEGRDEVWNHLTKRAEETGDERIIDAVWVLRYRFYSGGMEGDKRLMIAVAVLYLTEDDLSPPEMHEIDFTGRTGNWPWYVYDMHTRVGKKAMSKAKKELGIRSWDWLQSVWFNNESGLIYPMDERAVFWAELRRKVWLAWAKMSTTDWRSSDLRDFLATYLERESPKE